jgi:hypothetical protein
VSEVPVAANDTVAHEIAGKVIAAKVGSAECASLMTAELSDGNRYIIMRYSTYERDLKTRFERGKRFATRTEGTSNGWWNTE